MRLPLQIIVSDWYECGGGMATNRHWQWCQRGRSGRCVALVGAIVLSCSVLSHAAFGVSALTDHGHPLAGRDTIRTARHHFSTPTQKKHRRTRSPSSTEDHIIPQPRCRKKKNGSVVWPPPYSSSRSGAAASGWRGITSAFLRAPSTDIFVRNLGTRYHREEEDARASTQ